MGACRYQVLCVPLKRRETVNNKRELDNQCFHQYNKQTKVFDKVKAATIRETLPVVLDSHRFDLSFSKHGRRTVMAQRKMQPT